MTTEGDEGLGRLPVCVHVLESEGYVWDADDALWLRERCGIIGAMVGGVATYKQQNVVRGLPLQLSPEEVTLALEKKWATLSPALLDDETLLLHWDGQRDGPRGRLGFRNAFAHEDDEEDEDDGNGNDDEEEATIWQDCLAKGSFFSIPLTPEDAAAASRPANEGEEGFILPRKSSTGEECMSSRGDAASEGSNRRIPVWTFPSTAEERHRYIVFRDLHERGYKLTGGLKFGADYLVYPGDPTLYHAQLCVRLLPADNPILPIMLASACRGSFQARKHLLVASVIEIEQPLESQQEQLGIVSSKNVTQLDGHHYQIVYMTFGPVDGFG